MTKKKKVFYSFQHDVSTGPEHQVSVSRAAIRHRPTIHTFLGQVELFELGSFLVKFSLQLLFETKEFSPLLLQSSETSL